MDYSNTGRLYFVSTYRTRSVAYLLAIHLRMANTKSMHRYINFSGSLTVTGNVTVRQTTYDFVVAVDSPCLVQFVRCRKISVENR